MDRLKLTELLDLHPYGTLTVTRLDVSQWGHELALHCVYDPGEPGKPASFRLLFTDCRELHWRVYAHTLSPASSNGSPADSPADIAPTPLVNIRLGTDQHRKPANILTDTFGLTVLYGALRLERD